MFKTQIKIHFMRLRRFLNFSLRYFERHRPLQSFQAGILNSIKDVLGIYKKAKMAKFRVTSALTQLLAGLERDCGFPLLVRNRRDARSVPGPERSAAGKAAWIII